MTTIKNFLKQELVLVTALVLALGTSCFATPSLAYIDWQVLLILWALMLVVAGLKEVRFLDWLAIELLNKCSSFRQVAAALVFITYGASMFVTNDVALITFVPLALIIGRTINMDMGRVIIFQTLAANLGSMLTPPGNPQNLFLYAHYGYEAVGFLKVMALPGLLSLIYLGLLVEGVKSRPLTLELPQLPQPHLGRSSLYLVLLLLNIAAVLHALPKEYVLGLTLLLVLAVQSRLFKKVDYSLLVTFIGFFIFIGNISHLSLVQQLQASLLGTAAGTYLAGIGASQLISNVPAAMLLAGLTNQADALLLGVNIGGLGTLIASMASVISYKLFAADHPYQAGTYLRMFLFYNFGGLALIGTAVYFLCLS